MGPLLFRAEDTHRLAPMWNGAGGASMGPLLFRAEDIVLISLYLLALPTLQWGRSCSERKTVCQHPVIDRPVAASMGPLLFRAEDIAFTELHTSSP